MAPSEVTWAPERMPDYCLWFLKLRPANSRSEYMRLNGLYDRSSFGKFLLIPSLPGDFDCGYTLPNESASLDLGLLKYLAV